MNHAQSPICWTPAAPICLALPNVAAWQPQDAPDGPEWVEQGDMVCLDMTRYDKKPRSLGKAANTVLAVLDERPWLDFPAILAACLRQGVSDGACRRSVLYLFKSGRIGRRGERRHYQYARVNHG